MPFIDSLQALVLLLLWVGGAGVVAYALLDAVRQPSSSFQAISTRMTKQVWVAILGVAALLMFIAFPFSVLSIFGIASAVAGIVYTVDTRVKLRELRGRGGSSGPYGGW